MGVLSVARNYVRSVATNTQILLDYRRTFQYLWRRRGWWAAHNFLWMKLLVTEGAGNLGWVYIATWPLQRIFRRAFAWHAPYPVSLEVEGTTRCNKQCIICERTYWPKSEPRRDLSFDEFLKIVHQFPNLRWMDLTGEGDSFLNKCYLDMVAYLKKRDISVFLSDSLDLVNRDIARRLVEMGVDGIYVSFDASTPETYERLKVGCSFARTLTNLRNLLETKRELQSPIPEINFRYIVTTENLEEMPGFARLVAGLAQEYDLGDHPILEFAGLLHFPEVAHMFVPRVPEHVLAAVRETAAESPLAIAYAHADVRGRPPMYVCRAWMQPYIIIGGYVMPCCQVMQTNHRPTLRAHALGNLFETPFPDLWHSERYRRFRQMVATPHAPVPRLCQDCRAYNTRIREERYGVCVI